MICPSREEADKAINACHNKKTLPGVSFRGFYHLFLRALCLTSRMGGEGGKAR